MSFRALVLEAILRRVISSTPSNVDDEVARRRREGVPAPAEIPAAVRKRWRIERTVVDGSPVVTLRRARPAVRSLIFLAGGGYAHPITASHWSAAARFAERAGVDVVVPLYEVAPAGDVHRAHALVAEVLAAEIAARGPGAVFLSGDSAGGGLALSVLQRHPEGVAGAVLLNPWVDVEMSHPASHEMEHGDVILRVDELRQWGRAWAADTSTADPLVSPLNGPFDDLPPVHIVTGGRDLLLPDALETYRRLRAAGNAGTLTYEPDGNHAVGLMGTATPESSRALRAVVAALRA
jgi:acetyl esterase/lipase